MTTIINKTFHFSLSASLLLSALVMTSCDGDVFDLGADPAEGTTYKVTEGNPISTTLAEDGRFSRFVEVLRVSGLYNSLNQSTTGISFTSLAPNDDAMAEFEQRIGGKVTEQTVDYMRSFVLYHTIADSITTDNFVKKTSLSNLTGDNINVEIDTVKAGEAVLTNNNSEGRIVEMGLSASNGKIYVLSKALTPLVETLYDRLKQNSDYSLLCSAVDETGWKKTLATLADTTVVDGVQTITRHNFTVIGVTNASFAAAGINSLADLKAKLASSNDDADITVDSLLRAYVGYHILKTKVTVDGLGALQGNSLTHMWSTGADNLVFTVYNDTTDTKTDTKYTINAEGTAAHFVEANSNVLALNGYVHQIDSWMPIWEPEQQQVVWDFVDDNEIQSVVTDAGVEYQPAEAPKKQERVRLTNTTLFQNYVANDRKNNNFDDIDYYTVVAVTAKAIESGAKQANNNDCVVFNLGNAGSATLTTPTIVKGKYKVTLDVVYTTGHSKIRTKQVGTGGTLEITFDNDNRKYVAPYTQVKSTLSNPLAGVYTTTLYDEIEFDSTSTHEFKFTIKDSAATTEAGFSLQFDTMTFTPIKD